MNDVREKMNGQWIGVYSVGDTTGSIRIDIDELDSQYFGTAFVFDTNPKLPTAVLHFLTDNKASQFSFRTDQLQAIDPRSGDAALWDQIKSLFPADITFSEYADVRGSFNRDRLILSWTTNTGVSGKCDLPRSKADQPSELVPVAEDWGAFKDLAIERASTRSLFRGQRKQWRLRSPFHRSGRANMWRYVIDDIPTLHKNLSARTKHVFKLEQQDEFGAFISLIQHHGYPTPILDWTYSPYVAAFFAYRGITNEEAANSDKDAKVRILMFDARKWMTRYEAVTVLMNPKLSVTVRDFIAIENERMVPQQASSTVTSVDDIESFLVNRDRSTTYLRAIDLPVHERQDVIRELRYMGITAGSLFPGLDGTCEALAETNFGYFPGTSE